MVAKTSVASRETAVVSGSVAAASIAPTA